MDARALSPASLGCAARQRKVSVGEGEGKTELSAAGSTGPGVKGLELCPERGKLLHLEG